ncbi:hypothetical protein R3P38DRAFT_621703 [Favolaschia claudopus]|uniref:Uncharacterized protein n=1 Tax=Favolaschia claudopus TaxID=2862362 RepID=A0AAV9Z7D0_9AGAR
MSSFDGRRCRHLLIGAYGMESCGNPGLSVTGAPVFQSWTNDQGQVEVVHTSTAPPVSVISDADLLFLASDDASSLSLPRRHIYTYRGAKKQLWSITPFPTNSQGCPDTPCAHTLSMLLISDLIMFLATR